MADRSGKTGGRLAALGQVAGVVAVLTASGGVSGAFAAAPDGAALPQGQGAPQGQAAVMMAVPLGTDAGIARLLNVLTPDESQSRAVDGQDVNSVTTVRSRVIVRMEARADQASLERAVGVEVGVDGDGKIGKKSVLLAGAGRSELSIFAADAVGLPGYWYIDVATVRQAIEIATKLRGQATVLEASVDSWRPRVLRSLPSDPGIASQWFLNNTVNPQASTNAVPVWKFGYTGVGVTVGIVEGGFNAQHPDLAANFNAAASQLPPSWGEFDNHGTSTAGLVAASANNGIGGCGVAYGAKISRQYYGFDSDNAAAFLFVNDVNAIKSASWGPPDDGLLGPISGVELLSLQTAADTGRNGKGTVVFWAAGNGAESNDRVDYDQYASSRYVIPVGAVDNNDQRATYAERGSALMLVTTSSADFFGSGNSGIYTTTGSATSGAGAYTTTSGPGTFGGTSASAPIAAGVGALILQANPALTSRDVANVLIRTARRVQPGSGSWAINGAGRFVSDEFGFGAIDAAAAVAQAISYTSFGPEQTYEFASSNLNQAIPDGTVLGLVSTINVPSNLRVERVQVVLNAPHSRVGDLVVSLQSPRGTNSVFSAVRNDSSTGYVNWTFTTARCWDERAHGSWTLRISDQRAGLTGTLNNWTVRVIGTAPTCGADWDVDGQLGVPDIFVFLLDWFSGSADFNNDGVTSVPDLFAYLTGWFAGC